MMGLCMNNQASNAEKDDDQMIKRFARHNRRDNDARSPSDIDMARIIHSAAFRRLQGKTQILGLGDSDFYRTRLTHSIEVAQIASGIVRQLHRVEKNELKKKLLPDVPLITTICLAHDIGHPPFGHGGEIALNFLMRDHGGFEGNAQTLRLLHSLEPRSELGGLNLTRRTLLGVLKYPASYKDTNRQIHPKPKSESGPLDFTKIKIDDWEPPKCYYNVESELVEWVLEPFEQSDRTEFVKVEDFGPKKHKKSCRKSLDASIMNIADDIAYGVHDLEDAIEMKLLTKDTWEHDAKKCFLELPANLIRDLLFPLALDLSSDDVFKLFTEKLFDSKNSWRRKEAIGSLVNALVSRTSISLVEGYSDDPSAYLNLIRYNAKLEVSAETMLKCLKKIVRDNVIESASVQTLRYRGLHIVAKLFQTFITNPDRLLPEKTRDKFNRAGELGSYRVIADHIADMTDEYATKMYERLFVPREGTIFHQL